ncbi:unnamed protein product (macronuclear) [Paramecium tetraurelia]|uniref:Uncharacterized protein n=1 Tax=Paramecium tetraurelia TaxID=5888 RepID=A0EIJ7_PARTE|nr:uncharacterized protein GSPATT00027467001 [Paramecium tetraurelia]CAK95138.1 unnamed protein product [Paramecium tetraurelia]|eukprot:XP_001462511.1 hypothetical protein (macronuclear) [Paramecium tetraurelia strain d4-2]
MNLSKQINDLKFIKYYKLFNFNKMGCCQNRPFMQQQHNGNHKSQTYPNKMKLEPLLIAVIGDSDRMDMMDEIFFIKQTSIKEIHSPCHLRFPSESVIIDLRSGTSLASPPRQKSSKNLNQRFLEML